MWRAVWSAGWLSIGAAGSTRETGFGSRCASQSARQRTGTVAIRRNHETFDANCDCTGNGASPIACSAIDGTFPQYLFAGKGQRTGYTTRR